MDGWVLPGIFLSVYGVFFALNFYCIQNRYPIVPFLGALAGLLALLLLPYPLAETWKFFWVPIVFDFGTMVVLVGLFLDRRKHYRF